MRRFSSTGAPSSSVTLASLPAELHSVIARMCRDQDQQLRLRTSGRPDARHMEVALSGLTDWDGHSLNALSLVSRGWRMSATAYLFETITSDRCDDELFSFGIMGHYAHLIRHAHLSTTSDWTEQSSLLRVLPTLPSLRRLTLAASVFVDLLGLAPTVPAPSFEQQMRRSTLSRIMQSVVELSLEEIESEHLAWILAPLADSALLRLDLNAIELLGSPTERSSLSHLKNLQHLSVCSINDHLSEHLGDTSAVAFRLRTLELAFQDFDLGLDTWRFIQGFSDCLGALSIKLDNSVLSQELISYLEDVQHQHRVAFPALRRLRMEGCVTSVTTLLPLLSSSTVDSLDLTLLNYSYSPNLGDLSRAGDPLLPLFASLKPWSTSLKRLNITFTKTRATLCYVTNEVGMRRQVEALAPYAQFTVGPNYDAFQQRPTDLIVPSVGLSESCKAATGALKFGLDLVGRLEAMRDHEGAKALLKLLMPLRGKMLREKD